MREPLPVIAQDKANHFVYGAFIATVASILAGALHSPYALQLAVLAPVLVGAAKEIVWDKLLKRGDPTVGDFLWTSAGGIAVAIGMHAPGAF